MQHEKSCGAIVYRKSHGNTEILLIKHIKHNTALCEVDADKCIGCKKCLKVGCPAVMMENKKSRIDPTQCVGCTVCAQVCPKDAITRKER